jgi:outer membrane protein assembly factor BamB
MKTFFYQKMGKKIIQLSIIILTFSVFILPEYYGQQKTNYSIQKLADDPLLVFRLDKDGTIICDIATPEEMQLYSTAPSKDINYTIVPSLNPQSHVRGLKILLRATDQLLDNPEALLSFRRAAARWERYIRTNITVVIDVDYGVNRWGQPWGANVLGSTNSAVYQVTGTGVSQTVQKLKELHTGNSQLQDLYSAIPVPAPSTAGTNLGTLVGGIINLQALGYFPQEIDPDINVTPFGSIATIGFNSAFAFDFDPSDGIDHNKIDFDGVVTHEIGHALGYTSIAGNFPAAGPPNNYFYPWDLFRVRPEAVEEGSLTGFSTAQRVVTPGPPPSDVQVVENNVTYYKATQVFFEGLKKYEVSTATLSRLNGDGQQAPHWREAAQRPPSLGAERNIGIMNPTLAFGVREIIKPNDLRMLEVIGYDIDYSVDYAKILIVAYNDTLDLNKRTDTLYVGDIPLNSTAEYELQLINLDLDKTLLYEFEIVFDFLFPQNVNLSVSVDNPDGSISGGSSAVIKLLAGNSSEPASVFGTLRLHTNDENKLVIDIPFEFSIAGAKAPSVNLSVDNLGSFEFYNQSGSGEISKTFNLVNKGNMDLKYKIVPSLSVKSNYPPSSLPKSIPANNASSKTSILSKFFSAPMLQKVSVLYQTDFESDFGGFTAVGEKSEDWQRITLGAAQLDGHSKPTAAYYGKNYIDSLRYRNNAEAILVSSPFDFSSIPPQDKIVLAFNYYLKAEVGYDFASVHVSIDNGLTFDEVATSNSGILHNTDEWESVMIELPNLSGNSDNIYFAFKFKSDEYIEDIGWFIDDIEISVVEGANILYTIPRAGSLTGPDIPQEVLVTINGSQMEKGYYTGSISILSNDPRYPIKGVPFIVKNFRVGQAVPNILYGSTGRGSGSKGRVISINLNTGEGTEIGESGFEPVKSISINPLNQELYAFAKSVFDPTSKYIRISADDGFGMLLFESELEFTTTVFDNDGTLYLTTGNKKLYKLNADTGDTIFVADLGISVAALAVDPSTGELWAAVDESAENDRIYKIDKVTGDTTRVGRTGFNKKTRSLVFGPENNLYGTTGEETQFSFLVQIDKATGTGTEIGPVGYRGVLGMAFKYDPSLNVDDIPFETPTKFVLMQNYPNPFNPSTVINYQLPEGRHVTLKVFDILGREIKLLVNEFKEAGNHSVNFSVGSFGDASQFSSGVYIYSIKAGDFTSSKKMLLAK